MAAPLKIASWNVNSLRVRLPHVLDWLAAHRPDVVALQETKVPDEEFPRLEIEAAGYHVLYSGEKAYNGVALLSRSPFTGDAVTVLPGVTLPQRRLLVASVGDLRVVSLYVPNGQAVGSAQYDFKLDWMGKLADFLAAEMKHHRKLVVMGDFNVAPDERDVYDPLLWANSVLFSGPERAAFHRLVDLGFIDLLRAHHGDEPVYTWWDYRFNAFKRRRGLRIDHMLASPALARHCVSADVDTAPRGWERPSDHAPIVAQFDL